MKRGLPFAYLLFITMIASAVVLSPAGPYIVLILMISVVGIPVGLLLLATPTAFLFLTITGFFWFLFGAGGWIAKIAASLMAIAILGGIPLFVNHTFQANARLLASRDHDDITVGAPIRSLAIIDPTSRNQGDPVCAELCKRILLTGNVERLIIAVDDRTNPSPDLRGRLYRRYQGNNCPVIAFDENGDDLQLQGKRFQRGDKSTRDLLTLAAMNGHCIETSTALVESADTIIIRKSSTVREPKVTGWDIWAQDMSTTSLLVLQRKDDVLTETYRKTLVRYQALFPILAPTVTDMAFNGFGSNAVGFPRQNAVFGASHRYQTTPDIGSVVVDRLQFDLTLHQDTAARQARQLASSALRPSLLTAQQAAPAIAILFQSIELDRMPNGADLDIATQLILDDHVDLPDGLGMVVKRILDNRPELGTSLATILFRRLAAVTDKPFVDLTTAENIQFRRLTNAIASLPAAAVEGHFQIFDTIAHDDKRRELGYAIFKQLPEFGPRGLSLALFMIEDSWRFRKPDEPVNDAWQHPYLAGLTTICVMGPAARDALPKLEAMLKQNQIAEFSYYLELWTETVQRLSGKIDPKRQHACRNSA